MVLQEKFNSKKYKLERLAGSLLVNRGFGIALVIFIPIMAFSYFNANFGDGQLVVGFENVKSYLMALFDRSPINTGNVASESTQSTQISIFKKELTPIFEKPVELKIESVGIDIDLIEVGVDAEGTMETPKNWNEGGWYRKGAKTGEVGNIIINAHFDDNYGRPAAFWNLKNADVGDKVLLADRYGRIFVYSITDIFQVDIDDPNKLDVLDSKESESHLTMITCGGVWIPGKSTYNKRLVVKADLVQEVNLDAGNTSVI